MEAMLINNRFITQEMIDDCVFSNNTFTFGEDLKNIHNEMYGKTKKVCDVIERVADLPKKEEKIPHKCTCDFQTVILRYGCQCGGQ